MSRIVIAILVVVTSLLAAACGDSGVNQDGAKVSDSVVYSDAPSSPTMRPRVGDCFREAFLNSIPNRTTSVPCTGDYVFRILSIDSNENSFEACDEKVVRQMASIDDAFGTTLLVPSASLRKSGMRDVYCLADRAD